MIGQIISHYKILEKLGEGGMGVVYGAEDTKLKRIVALKFLPPEFTRDKDAKERFFIEAQAAASLSHSNIVTVHEIDEYEDQIYIAIEYVEGQSLKDKIESGPLNIDDALKIAIQTAEGLNEAHEKGIVHRDIKSANIMITDKGHVKIMDFGLAKLKGKSKLTKAGTTVGTASYMSPEQSMGKKVDHRTDIWSLGVVLYEMITGQLPFKGDYEQAVVYSILNEEPEPVTGLRTGVPVELERIINKALVKDPSERYQHVDDMMVDLRKLKKDSKPEVTVTRKKTSPEITLKASRKVLTLGGILLAAVIIAGYFIFKGKPEPVIPVLDTGGKPSIAIVYFENNSGGTATSYLFISWDLTEENLDAYIEPDLFNKNGERIKLISDQIDLATIAGCTEAVNIGGIDTAMPKIRARLVYELPSGQYLVKFYISEPASVGNFRLVIL